LRYLHLLISDKETLSDPKRSVQLSKVTVHAGSVLSEKIIPCPVDSRLNPDIQTTRADVRDITQHLRVNFRYTLTPSAENNATLS